MPFTPSHAALVLPLVRISPRYVSATGLIIGSMAPDFLYFFSLSSDAEFGHTLAGLVLFDLPVSVLLALLFHQVVKRQLVIHLPAFLQERLQPLKQLDFLAHLRTHAVAFAVSALVGAASHIAWDGFTHGDGYFVRHLSFYHDSVVPFEGVRYPLWYALQNICSWVGLAIVILYVLGLKPRGGAVPAPSPVGYWCFVLLIFLLVVGVRFQFDLEGARVGNLIVSSISGLCLGVVLAGFIPFAAASGYR